MTLSSGASKGGACPEGRFGGGGQQGNRVREGGQSNDCVNGRRPERRAPRYTLRPVTIPLSSQMQGAGVRCGGADSGSAASGDAGVKPASRNLVLRGENEDDDGYDPYSDYHDGTARSLRFERDPWN